MQERIAVIGLGYVGLPVALAFARKYPGTIGFDVNVALMWGKPIRLGTRSTMANPTVNNYTAGDGKRFWVVGLEGERHWPPLARAVGQAEEGVKQYFKGK